MILQSLRWMRVLSKKWHRQYKLVDQQAHLFIVFRRGAEDCEFWAARFWFGRFAGVEEGLDERLQVLPFLTEKPQDWRITFISWKLNNKIEYRVGLRQNFLLCDDRKCQGDKRQKHHKTHTCTPNQQAAVHSSPLLSACWAPTWWSSLQNINISSQLMYGSVTFLRLRLYHKCSSTQKPKVGLCQHFCSVVPRVLTLARNLPARCFVAGSRCT